MVRRACPVQFGELAYPLNSPCYTDERKTCKKYDWSNISHKYKRDLKDWQRLCASCHTRFDDSITKGWITKKILRKTRKEVSDDETTC